MKSYTNTDVYLASLKFYDKIAEICGKKNSEPLFFNMETQAIKLTSNIALAIDKNTSEEQNEKLEKCFKHFSIIRQHLDLAHHRKQISENEIDEIEEEIRIMKNRIDQFINYRQTILILSSNMGQGHLSAAKAIKQGLESLYGKNYNIIIIDFVEKLGSFFNKASLKTYENSTKYLPNAYKFFFESTDSKWQVKLLNLINYPLNSKKIKRLFSGYNPTLTISTFPIWDYLAKMVLKKINKEKFISVITDSISIHRCWLSGDPDFHIVANQETAESLIKIGANPTKIKILGFPVKLDFQIKANKKEFLESIGLNDNKFTVLYLPTAGKNLATSKRLNELIEIKNINIIVICGRDKELLPKLTKRFKNEKNIRIIGWTNQMAEYIKTSDLVITKAGGATVMECIAAKKPMIITQIIPGQEMGNAILIKKHNLGLLSKEVNMSIGECVKYIKKHYNHFLKNIDKISNPEATLNIAEFIQEQMRN